jgi:hypothetical protein
MPLADSILLVTRNLGAYQGAGTFTATATGEVPAIPAPKFFSASAGKQNADTAAAVATAVSDLKRAMKVSVATAPAWPL